MSHKQEDEKLIDLFCSQYQHAHYMSHWLIKAIQTDSWNDTDYIHIFRHLILIYILGKAKSISSFGQLPKSCTAYYYALNICLMIVKFLNPMAWLWCLLKYFIKGKCLEHSEHRIKFLLLVGHKVFFQWLLLPWLHWFAFWIPVPKHFKQSEAGGGTWLLP